MPKKIKPKQKKAIKQALPKGLASRGPKQKQNQKVNVKQNVKVVIGDIKRKRVVRSSGTKSGAPAKPPIILNISNPQPYNNPYMEYFKKQLQNQQPVQANTLSQQVALKEKQETEASKAGALGKLVQEPGADVQRELRSQAAITRAAMAKSKAQIYQQYDEVAARMKTPKTNKKRTPKRRTVVRSEDDEEDENPFTHLMDTQQEDDSQSGMAAAMEQQQTEMESAISSKGGAGAGAEDIPATPVLERASSKRGRPASDLPTPNPDSSSDDVLKELRSYSEEQLQQKLKGINKVNQYMKLLMLPIRVKGNKQLSAEEKRQAIIGLVRNFKRDTDVGK